MRIKVKIYCPNTGKRGKNITFFTNRFFVVKKCPVCGIEDCNFRMRVIPLKKIMTKKELLKILENLIKEVKQSGYSNKD